METFTATSGRITGTIGLGMTGVVAVVFVLTAPAHVAVPGVLACGLAAVLLWGSMLRPSVSASADVLVLRTLLETVTIPLAGIDSVVVRRYLLVSAGGRKYVCPAISRSLRKSVRAEMKGGGGLLSSGGLVGRGSDLMAAPEVKVPGDIPYADFVEDRILQLAATARAQQGIEERSEEEYEIGRQAQRRIFWPVVAALVVLVVAFVVSLFVL